MSLPTVALVDMQDTFGKLRLKGLRYCVIRGKTDAMVPWIIIDKASNLRKRFMSARAAIRGDGPANDYFKLSTAEVGEVRKVGRRLVFVPDEEPSTALETKLSGRWAQHLRSEKLEGRAVLASFCELLTRSLVLTSEELEKERAALEDALVPYEGLTTEQLSETFDADTEEVVSAVPTHSQLNDRIELPHEALSDEGLGSAVRAVRSSLPLDLFEDTAQLVPHLIKIAASTDASRLELGEEASLNDKIHCLTSRFVKWWWLADKLDVDQVVLLDRSEAHDKTGDPLPDDWHERVSRAGDDLKHVVSEYLDLKSLYEDMQAANS